MQIEIFSKVKDTRVIMEVKHEQEDGLRIALIGVLGSCEDYDEVSDLIRVQEYGICIAEKRVDDKTNELTVFPSVIASMCIVGALVSVDAMDTHSNIAQQIILQDGNYLMALKNNQPILKELVESLFKAASHLSTYATEEKGYGREGKRKRAVLDTKLLEQEGMYEEWPGLKRIVIMERERL